MDREHTIYDAVIRVGPDAQSHLRWLLKFAHTDLTRLSSKRIRALRAEIKAFAAGVPNMKEWDLDGWAVVMASFIEVPPMPSQSDLRRIHAWLAEGVRAVEQGTPWSFESSPKHDVSWQWEDTEEGQVTQEAGLIIYESGDLLEQFAARVSHNINAAGMSARRCAADDCRALYVPDHGRMTYCSERCSHRVRTARWRRSHPGEAQRIRHEQYRKDVRMSRGLAIARHVRPREG
jgi:hypothetical protein